VAEGDVCRKTQFGCRKILGGDCLRLSCSCCTKGPKSGSPVEFATGRNWFVVDYSAAPNGATTDRDVDMKDLAEKLDAHYISADGE